MLFDVHAHLSFPEFSRDLDEVLNRAFTEEVFVVNCTVSPNEAPSALDIAKRFEKVYWTIGLSPSDETESSVNETIRLMKKHIRDIRGVGKVGLDYYWVKKEDKRKQQRIFFKKFIDASNELKMPLVVHSRDAEEDTLRILEDKRAKALLHCFSGSIDEAKKAVDLGCLISIPTSIAHSKKKKELAKAISLENIVLETDAPYLAPTPKTRNEPANVKESARIIGEIKGVGWSVVADATTENAKRFFRL